MAVPAAVTELLGLEIEARLLQGRDHLIRGAVADIGRLLQILDCLRAPVTFEIGIGRIKVRRCVPQPLGDQIRLGRTGMAQGDVSLAALQILYLVRGDDIEGDARRDIRQTPQDRRQHIGRGQIGRGDRHPALDRLHLSAGGQRNAACRLAHLADMVQQHVARVGQRQAPANPFKQRNLKRLFQRRDLPAEGGLGQTKRTGCRAERTLFRRHEERADLVPVECYTLPIHAFSYIFDAYLENLPVISAYLYAPAKEHNHDQQCSILE